MGALGEQSPRATRSQPTQKFSLQGPKSQPIRRRDLDISAPQSSYYVHKPLAPFAAYPLPFTKIPAEIDEERVTTRFV